jgi:hypothetical protein
VQQMLRHQQWSQLHLLLRRGLAQRVLMKLLLFHLHQ